MISKSFSFVEELFPSQKWQAHYEESCSAYRKWFLKEGELNRPNYLQCERMLRRHMPELIPIWEHLVNLAGGDDLTARLLSLYCPTPYVSACSQAVWTRYSPVLIRNYDYTPSRCEGLILKSKWHSTQVIASIDCLWGVLDGMNEHGLIVSLSFGGKNEVGKGFGIPLILRYILEFCKTTQEATDTLCRIPSHMAYNITFMDAQFHVSTIEISPSSPPEISHKPFAVNHQGGFSLNNYATFSKSYEREHTLITQLSDPNTTLESFITAFQYAPLWNTNEDPNFGTVYTAIYNPSAKAVEFRWPHQIQCTQSFARFEPKDMEVHY